MNTISPGENSIDPIDSISYNALGGEVLELADRRDLGSRAARREGSTPSFPIESPFSNPIQLFYFYLREHISGVDKILG